MHLAYLAAHYQPAERSMFHPQGEGELRKGVRYSWHDTTFIAPVLSQHLFRSVRNLSSRLVRGICFIKHPLPSSAYNTLRRGFQ